MDDHCIAEKFRVPPPLPAFSSPVNVAAPAPPSVHPPPSTSVLPLSVSELPEASVAEPVPVIVPPDQVLDAPFSISMPPRR